MTLAHTRTVDTSADALLGASVVAAACACLLSSAAVADGPVVCPFRLVTGLPCPGCGSTRAWVAVTNGYLPAALAFNPFATVLLVAVVGFAGWRGASLVSSIPAPPIARIGRHPLTITLGIAWLAWGIARAAGAL